MSYNTPIDRNTDLCLACSASLPPANKCQDSDIFVTQCCRQPICPSCVSANPRLTRYNPCLACLNGVGLIASGSRTKEALLKSPTSATVDAASININGAVREQDTFVLGDSDDDEEEGDGADGDEAFGRGGECIEGQTVPLSSAPPNDPNIDPWKEATSPTSVVIQHSARNTTDTPAAAPSTTEVDGQGKEACANGDGSLANGLDVPPSDKYYLQANDTLQGIALRFRVDAQELCKINKLPLSTIRTTPHLLHTRVYITLPPGSQVPLSAKISKRETDAQEANRVRERAALRLQRLTKEADWRVAKAYVALAEDEGEAGEFQRKRKEMGYGDCGGIEEIAVSQYLDDLEWEREQMKIKSRTVSKA